MVVFLISYQLFRKRRKKDEKVFPLLVSNHSVVSFSEYERSISGAGCRGTEVSMLTGCITTFVVSHQIFRPMQAQVQARLNDIVFEDTIATFCVLSASLHDMV